MLSRCCRRPRASPSICFCSSMVTAKSFGVRNRYEVEANREFIALGIANIVSGLSSGFVIAGADSRTAISDLSGGRSQLSGVSAAVVMAVVLMWFTAPLAYIPNASLGAVLILAGASLFDVAALKRIWDISRAEFVLSILTTLGVATIGVLPAIALTVMLQPAAPATTGFTSLRRDPGTDSRPGRSRRHKRRYSGAADSRYCDLSLRCGFAFLQCRSLQEPCARDYWAGRQAGAPLHFRYGISQRDRCDGAGGVGGNEVSAGVERNRVRGCARKSCEVSEAMIRSGCRERIGAINFFPSVRSALQAALNSPAAPL